MKIDEDRSFGRLSKTEKRKKKRFANKWRHIPKVLHAYIIELPQLVDGRCYDLSPNREPLPVKHKKTFGR